MERDYLAGANNNANKKSLHASMKIFCGATRIERGHKDFQSLSPTDITVMQICKALFTV